MGRIDVALHRLGSLDELARRDTPATRLDPRAKLLVTAGYVAAVVSFGRLELFRLAPLLALGLLAGPLSEVPWRPLLLRLALAAPFALGVAAFEPLLDRSPALSLGGLSVSGGQVAFLVVVGKFALSLGAALLLVATTGFDSVCAALGRLGLPRILVGQLSLTYRYLFVLAEEGGRMVRAHELRARGTRLPRPRIAAALLGGLLVRALGRAERIHAAMQARGFTGRLPRGRAWRFRRADAAFAAVSLVALAAVRLVDLPAWLGSAALGAWR